MSVFALAIGGFFGAISRYLIGLILGNASRKSPVPLAMLIVNVLGSFGLGYFTGKYFVRLENPYENLLFLTVGIGFFGSFTTFSTFSNEAVLLMKQKMYLNVILYISISIIGSILLFAGGFALAR